MCVRDAYCELLRWPTGSAEWSRFIEYPHQDDLLPLARHLGVSVYDVGIAWHWNELIGKLDHPGIAIFDIPAAAIGHAVYVPTSTRCSTTGPKSAGIPGRTCRPSAGRWYAGTCSRFRRDEGAGQRVDIRPQKRNLLETRLSLG